MIELHIPVDPRYILTSSAQHLLMDCETSSAWRELGYVNMAIHFYRICFGLWISGRREYLLSEKLHENILSIHLESIHSTMSSIYQVPNQCTHRAGSTLQRHLSAGEPSLCRGFPDPLSSRVQYLCECRSRSIQTDPKG